MDDQFEPSESETAPTETANIVPAPIDAEADVLDGLEQDLAAVTEAMQTLDRITAEGVGGDAAAAQITSVVSAERFPDGAPVIQVDLTGG